MLSIVYHHDTIFSNNGFNTGMKTEEKARSKLYKDISKEEAEITKRVVASGELNYTFITGKPKTAENLEKANLVPVVFFEVLTYEFGDKTFLLLIVFCIIWQSGRSQNDSLDSAGVFNSNNLVGLRIFISSSIGISILILF
jgi:hypothetical protein